MHDFLEALRIQRWDDHRYYHHSRINQSLHLVSALSFLGLGVQPPNADWGVMVRENLQGLLFGSTAPLIPAAAIASVTVAINLLVDWRLRQTHRDDSYEPVP